MEQLSEMRTEIRKFTMHQNMLRDVIERQAGSLDKAVLEGVMNLIEAEASEGLITITNDQLIVRDDGHGFSSKDEILKCFEVFGKSDERKSLEARWAEFQMGRGQLMAFGVTTYRTNTFEMRVDLRSCRDDIEYALTEGLEHLPGCTVTVELYDPLDEATLGEVIENVGRNVRYTPVPVYVNGDLVSKDPREEKWFRETEIAYYSLGGWNLSVYNLGVHVRSLTEKTAGMNGVVVSKKRLKLTFGRNEVITSCAVWAEIQAELKVIVKESLLNVKTPSAEQVKYIITNWLLGLFEARDFLKCNIFRDTNGKRWSLDAIIEQRIPYYSFDAKHSIKADKVMQSGVALMLDEKFTAECFSCFVGKTHHKAFGVLQKLFAALENGEIRFKQHRLIYRSADDLYEELEDSHTIIPETQLTTKEVALLSIFNHWSAWYADAFGHEPARRFVIGLSDTAGAWTDARGYIAFDRHYLMKAVTSLGGWCQVMLDWAHEYAHIDGDHLTHDDAFFERYERNSRIACEHMEQMMTSYMARLRREGKKVTHKLKSSLEHTAQITHLSESLDTSQAMVSGNPE